MKMPIAVALGVDPVTMMISATPYPAGVNEYDVIGAIRGEPMKLVKCETNELMFLPTRKSYWKGNCMDPSTFRMEGPFGEYPGYYSSIDSTPKHVFNVKCVTYRNDPIYTSGLIGCGPHLKAADLDYFGAITFSAVTWDQLDINRVPGVKDVWFNENM